MKKLTKRIEIDLEFGSDYQKELYESMIVLVIQSVQLRMEETHKGNSIKVKILDK